jgi:hypothetical protein
LTRWADDYILLNDQDFEGFWSARAALGLQTLYIFGEGFDPRIGSVIERFIVHSPEGTTLMRLGLRPSPLLQDEAQAVALNRDHIEKLAMAGGVTLESIAYPDVQDAKSAGRKVMRDLFQAQRFDGSDQIVVDLSALPLDVYFVVLRDLLRAREQNVWSGELFIVACENPKLDAAIVHEGSEESAFLPGFAAGSEATAGGPTVWIPLLGEGRSEEIQRVFEFLRPNEICPVLPSPSDDPRRSDDLVVELRDLLFEVMGVDARNFIYASEWNPFDLFRSLRLIKEHYAPLLEPLGQVRFAVSSHSSKLLSLGALLAAYEHDFAVVHTTPSGYFMRNGTDVAALRQHDRVFCAWIDGSPFET